MFLNDGADGKLEAIGYVAAEGGVASPLVNAVNMVRVPGWHVRLQQQLMETETRPPATCLEYDCVHH